MVDSLISPLFQYKMPLFDGTVASTGLSKPKTMSDYLNKQTPQYSEAFFPYDPRGREGAQFTPPWSNSKTPLLDGRSGMSHLSGMEGKQHMFFRQNSNCSKEGTVPLSPLHATPVKQGFTLYNKSPGVGSSPAVTSVAVGKPRSGGEDSSPPPGSPVYLAVPKPVYGHNPCCSDLCCVRGRYCVESGFPRLPHPVYKHNWIQTDAQYGESAAVQKNTRDALLQHRGLQFDAGDERLKRIDAYSQGRVRPLPSIIKPNYSSNTCTYFGSFGEQSQQTSPRAYPNVFPSHHAYEHMTSEVYQEHSPMTKYGHGTQRPVFYYSQADVEVENRSQCKNSGSREDSPVAAKHALLSPQDHFVVAKLLHGEATLPHFQPHALLQGFGYPCYGGPRFNVGARQSMKKPPVVHPNNVHFSPTNICPDYHIASVSSLHEDTGRLGVGCSDASSFLREDQSNPPRYSNQPVVPTPGVTMNRVFHPPGLNLPGLQTPGLNVERFLPYPSSGGQVMCPKLSGIHPISLGSQLHPSLHHYPDLIHKVTHDQSNVCSSSVTREGKPNNTTSCLTNGLKRNLPQLSPPIKIKEERDLEEDEPLKKLKKVEEKEAMCVRSATESPPLPIINSVFSLAPYQAHLQASGGLLPSRTLHSIVQSENHAVQMQPVISEQKEGHGENQPLVCRGSKEICASGAADIPTEELRKPQDIKVEKEASDDFAADQQDCPTTEVGKQPEETRECSIKSPVIKTCEPDELEMTPVAVKNEALDHSNPDGSVAPSKPSPQSNADVAGQPKPNLSSQPSERKFSFKNIPPCCLKLSTYNIALPKAKRFSPAPAPEKLPVPPITKNVPNLDFHLPVRKHFYELHHSLYKLISKSVFGTSEQELRTLLTQLEVSEVALPSGKIKNMSSLLGAKPRELWFNEEVKSVFQDLVKRLKEYTAQDRCPFPHVMRTTAIFLPMLVLKELLFPMVQSSFVDQVLQEHRVELRPTTLSEEKILLQLHNRACSSRLRKLMSLKHLPDIYADMVNILYYTCISKHLGKCTVLRRCCVLSCSTSQKIFNALYCLVFSLFQ